MPCIIIELGVFSGPEDTQLDTDPWVLVIIVEIEHVICLLVVCDRSDALLGLQTAVSKDQLLVEVTHPTIPLVGGPSVYEVTDLHIDKSKHGNHKQQADEKYYQNSTDKDYFFYFCKVLRIWADFLVERVSEIIVCVDYLGQGFSF